MSLWEVAGWKRKSGSWKNNRKISAILNNQINNNYYEGINLAEINLKAYVHQDLYTFNNI